MTSPTPGNVSPGQLVFGSTLEDDDRGTMQAFIRSQMYSIMHPVAEHVREVQAEVQQLAKRIKATDGKVDEGRLCMEQQHHEFLALRKSISSTDANLEKLVNDFGISNREREKLSTDHEVTKSDLAKLAGDVRTSNVVLKTMQQKSEDHDSDIRSLHMALEKMGVTCSQEAEKLAQTMEQTKGLNLRIMDIMKSIDDLARSVAENFRGMHMLKTQVEKSNAALDGERVKQQEFIDMLERRLCGTQQDVKTNADAIRDIVEQLRLLKNSLHSGSDRTDAAHGDTRNFNQGDRPENNMKFHVDVDGLKAALNKLQEIFNSHKDEYSQLYKDLDRRMGDNTRRIEGLHVAKESMSEHLKKNDMFLARLQQALDAVGGQVDMLQADMKSMHANVTDLANKAEVQRIGLTKTQADLRNTDDRVEASNENTLRLKEALAQLDHGVSKLGSRYDSCSRNLAGVSRGLADVGKHVSHGDHGLLAPRSPLTNRLPHLGFSNSPSPETTLSSAR